MEENYYFSIFKSNKIKYFELLSACDENLKKTKNLNININVKYLDHIPIPNFEKTWMLL